jgi:hypothetical protein
MDFDVDESGNLDYGPAETILPLYGDEPQSGEHRFYDVNDVWGTADHGKLYLAVTRGGTVGAEALIYDLNALTDVYDSPEVRTIHIGFANWQPGGWQDAGDPSSLPDCSSVLSPQFVPTCYAQPRMTFNASGTRLYLNSGLGRDLQGFDTEFWGVMRIATDDMAAGVPLADWNLAGPELVFANDLNNGGPSNGRPRPGVDPYGLPSPEILSASDEALDADLCVGSYSLYADGDGPPQSSIRQDCIVDGFVLPQHDIVWDSPISGLFGRFDYKGKGSWSLHRTLVADGSSGSEEKLLGDNVWSADTGL